MLNMGLQTAFWTVLFMIRVATGVYELNIISFILTRRDGLDANALERLSCEIGKLAFWVPVVGAMIKK